MSEDSQWSREELNQRIAEKRAELERLAESLSPEDFEKPLRDGWSAKVHVAHVADWERSLIGILRGESRPAVMNVPEDVWASSDTDAINAVLARRADEQPASSVRERFDSVHTELMALLDGMSKEDLDKPYSHYQPNDGAHNPKPVVGWVMGNTFEHYDEHIDWLKAGLRE